MYNYLYTAYAAGQLRINKLSVIKVIPKLL